MRRLALCLTSSGLEGVDARIVNKTLHDETIIEARDAIAEAGLHAKRIASGSPWQQFNKSLFIDLQLGNFSPLTCAVRNKSFKQPPVQARRKFTSLSSLLRNGGAKIFAVFESFVYQIAAN